MAKLVIIRGASGAGKSTIARGVAAATARHLAVIDRDQFMFMFNRWPDSPDQELLRLVILFCLEKDMDVVFEGNFKVETHAALLDELFAAHPTTTTSSTWTCRWKRRCGGTAPDPS